MASLGLQPAAAGGIMGRRSWAAAAGANPAMAIAASGTFDYVATVPQLVGDSFECRTRIRRPVAPTGFDSSNSRLVGLAPLLRVTDAGLTPDAGPQRPSVMRSRLTLTADGQGHAAAAEASFHIDRAVTSRVAPGDTIQLIRTECGGLGVSVTRKGALVVAVGALTALELGAHVTAALPADLFGSASEIFRKRDPDFEFPELPLEVRIGATHVILYSGTRTVEEYRVFVVHGFLQGEPGTDACGSIWRTEACPDVAARASAMLLDAPDCLRISKW